MYTAFLVFMTVESCLVSGRLLTGQQSVAPVHTCLAMTHSLHTVWIMDVIAAYYAS
jgi:hypothetical protein